jgi:hypothetical protein
VPRGKLTDCSLNLIYKSSFQTKNDLQDQPPGVVSFARAILRRTSTVLTKTSDFGIDLSTGVCVQEWVTCQAIPSDVASTPSAAGPWPRKLPIPVLKESLTDAAQRWALLATELETIHSLLQALEEPEKKGLTVGEG